MGGSEPAPAPRSPSQEAIAPLAERYGLPADATARLACFLELLSTERDAPTAIRAPERVLEDHLADSLVAVDLEQVRSATEAVDLGSGAGLPGIPLAIALPGAHVTLLEASSPKCRFIERAVSACALANASVVCERAESWRAGLGQMDLVTARAVGPLPVVVEYAAPLLRTEGWLVVWRGRPDPAAETRAAVAAEHLGLRDLGSRTVEPYAGVRHRYLHLMVKVRETPPGFPRRPGMAVKRPLGTQHRPARDRSKV